MLLKKILCVADSALTGFSLASSDRGLSFVAWNQKIFKEHCRIRTFLYPFLRSRYIHIRRWWAAGNTGAVAYRAGCWSDCSVDILLEIFGFLLNSQLLLLLFLTLRSNNNLLIGFRQIHLDYRILNQSGIIITNRNKYSLLIDSLWLEPKGEGICQMQGILVDQVEIRIVLNGCVYKGGTIYCWVNKVTFDTELPEMIEDEHDLLSGLIPKHLWLQITLVDTNYQWNTNIALQSTLRQGNVNLLLISLLELKHFPFMNKINSYFNLPFSSNSGYLNFLYIV